MQANVGRLTDMQGYLKVRAPFAGVVTLRNVDVGTLVNTGSTMLFRIAQTNLLRTYLNVPQSSADRRACRTDGVTGDARASGTQVLGNRHTHRERHGSRQPHVIGGGAGAESGRQTAPGMYVEVDLHLPRKDPPLLLPSDTLSVRPEGTMVAVARLGQPRSFPARGYRPGLWKQHRNPFGTQRRTAGDRESERFRPGRREGSSGPGSGRRKRTETLALARALPCSLVL